MDWASLRCGRGMLGEQVVLDLVVEAPEEPVGEQAVPDVAGREDLEPQVSPPLAVVVGSEGHAQVQPEQGLVEPREDECVRERHGRQEEGDVPGDEERTLHQSFAAGLTAQVRKPWSFK